MRKIVYLITFMIMAVLFTGCANKKTYAEGDKKTETVVENIDTGMSPQVIEKSITYVMKDGNWQEERSEITDWKNSLRTVCLPLSHVQVFYGRSDRYLLQHLRTYRIYVSLQLRS